MPKTLAVVLASLLALGSAASAALFVFGPSRSVVDEFRAGVHARGGKLQIRDIERGLFVDVLHDVRVEMADGAALEAPEVRISRRGLGSPGVRIPRVRIVMTEDAFSSFSTLRRLDLERTGLDIGDVAFEYRHRSVGRLVLDGVTRAGSPSEHAFTVKQLRYGRAVWSDVTLSVTARNQVLEVRFGAPNSVPNATARYIPSTGRAAEWMIDVPNQLFGPLRRSLGLGPVLGEETSRITGVFSWVVPDDPGVSPRGSFHGVMDAWYQPPWKEAATLTGSSGSFAAVIVPAPDGGGLRLERVEVAAALFDLRGSGSITFAEKPEINFRATGKRTCEELAKHLPPSRYRDAVRASLGSERGAVSPGADAVELELRVLLPSAPGERAFRWHLAPGCGLRELTHEAVGPD